MMREDEKSGMYEKSSPEWLLAEELTKRIIIALQNTFVVSNEPSDEGWKELAGDWEEFIHDKLEQYAQQFKEGVGQKEAWISVKTRLPQQGGYYLTVKFGFTPDVSTFFDDEWLDYHDRSIIAPTHWMELPEPPQK